MSYQCLESPIGPLLIAADGKGLREIRFLGREIPTIPTEWEEADADTKAGSIVERTVTQLREYFAGKRRSFRLPLAPRGTEFQQSVWDALCGIGYGEIVSYGEIAKRVGSPQASRAVGAANGSNPIPIVIPCHRVIGASGMLTGYGGGLDIKEHLLRLEGVPVKTGDSRKSRVPADQMRLML
ncbi:MAG: methylated-DNA--[protein]-cysteine S-methyltransferase [Candidatus Eisenbacteria bacterium]|uniref:Methylated-DNA--protein-cysteine methyltransferase n=1 Tax=Eiseniibacteriota bacterium TaxID=2212470 RepID=A0A956RPL0_UNCEI|nr:methylated-DNA--[protein]-cysteine S-methyltransferase [Candidatus Eisenbacteria bacterium]